MKFRSTFLKSYAFSLLLVASIILGSVLGVVLGPRASYLKPFGDVFLNLLFTLVTPIVFFSMASAMAGMTNARRLGRVLGWMLLFFVLTAVLSSLLMIVAVRWYPPGAGTPMTLPTATTLEAVNLSDQIVRTFTVGSFSDLLTRRNMLPLILFSILVGLAAAAVGEKGRAFGDFLQAGNAVMAKALSYVMLYAPIGLGAYFGYLVGTFGSQLLDSYVRTVTLYYPLALVYFFGGFTFYAGLAGGARGIRTFWSNIIPPSLTAWATGSSVATIPTNLAAAERIGIPRDIREVVIPIGATIHMDGSCLAAVLKIAFLFSLFGRSFTGVDALLAVGAAILAGIVMSGIPGGGFLGELMIVTLYGFPAEALPLISMIGTLVDPPATMVNAAGDNVTGMMVARVLEGKNWMEKPQAA